MTAPIDRARIAAAVRELLAAIGADPESQELEATPTRVAESYAEFFSGVGEDPEQFLTDAIPVEGGIGEIVIMRDIELRSMCEHHLLPFRGRAHVAYRPGTKIVGLSALPKVVGSLASRPQVQERLGEQIAQALENGLAPEGVLVVLEAHHGCVADRGVRESHAVAITVAARGTLAEPAARAEAIALIAPGRKDS
ncbi:GTP cyclohydrolase I FolE [Leucobacter sp. CX328]|uniref:GTP cyclohydrolase I FolE n=1 Tax=unclassified Leucobacter TaxID=2621730 RepID=UPI003342BA1E